MGGLVKFSVKHPVSVLSLYCALILCCIVSLFTIKFDLLPKIDERFLLISTEYSGLSADEMKILVTRPIEDSASSLKGLKNISSVSRNGLSLVTVEVHWNTNINLALTECKGIIDECYENLPSMCSKPEVRIFNPKRKASLILSITPLDGDLKYARHISQKDIKKRIQGIKGVSSVMVLGGEKEEIRLVLDKDKAEKSHLDINMVSQMLASSNFEYPAGKILEGNNEYSFKTSGLFSSLQDILDTPLFCSSDSFVKVSDIGFVENTSEEIFSFFLQKDSPAVCLEIYKKSDASPLDLSRQIKSEIKELCNLYGNYYEFNLLYDEAEDLKSSIFQLSLSALSGCLVTIILLLIFFRSFRASFLLSSIIPLSIFFSVLVLKCAHSSINVMSLSGIAVGIGMVIDTSLIAFESFSKNYSSSLSLEKSVIQGVSSVSFSNFSSSLTTIIVFLPLFFISGLSRMLFKDMAIAIVSSIAFSCVLSLTFIPSMISLVYKRHPYKASRELSFSRLESSYSKILNFSFDKKWITALLLIFSLVLSVLLGFTLKKEILPKTFSREIVVKIDFPKNTNICLVLEQTKLICREIERFEEIETYYVKGGIDESDYSSFADESKIPESIEIHCMSEKSEKLKKKITSLFSKTNLDYVIQDRPDIISSLLAIENNCFIVSSPSDVLDFLSGFENISVAPDYVLKDYVFVPDRQAMAKYSVSALDCAQIIYNILNGNVATRFFKDGRQIPVRVTYPEKTFSDEQQLESLLVGCDSGYVPLKVLGKIEEREKEKIFYRYSKEDAKKVYIKGENKEFINNVKKQGLNCVSLKDLQMKELFSNAAVLLIIILLLLYCIMGAQFQSFLIPLLIMTSILPCFAGAFLFLFVFAQSINVNSIVALIILFGTSVNNAIILYESLLHKSLLYKRLQNQVLTKEVVIECSVKKLRSIVITTLTSILALLPFAIDPLNKNSQSSMAIAIIGGLSFSFITVLLIMPKILYVGMSAREKGKKIGGNS